jgi:uncharacterized protein YlxP (DUF503 family)
MVIGTCTIQLYLPGNSSLKGKRRVIKSIMARLQREFNIAIAEVDHQDSWQQATLGVACVSTSADHAHSMLTSVINWIEANRPDVPLEEFQIELL